MVIFFMCIQLNSFLGIFMPLVFILVSITHLCLLLLVMVCELAYTKQLN